MTVSWQRSSDRVGVAGYIVYRDGVRIGSTAASRTRYVVSSLTCGTSHRIAVQAYDRAGNRSARAVILAATSACVDAEAPSVPANVAQTAVTSSSITISWTASTDNLGVVGYEVLSDGALAGSTASTLYRAHRASLRGDVHHRRSGARRGRSPLRCGQHPGHDGRLPRYRSPVVALVAQSDLGQPDLHQRPLVCGHRRQRRGRIRRLPRQRAGRFDGRDVLHGREPLVRGQLCRSPSTPTTRPETALAGRRSPPRRAQCPAPAPPRPVTRPRPAFRPGSP